MVAVELISARLLIAKGCFFFFQAEDGIRDLTVTGVQTCALPILTRRDATKWIGATMIASNVPQQTTAGTAFGLATPESVGFSTDLPKRFETPSDVRQKVPHVRTWGRSLPMPSRPRGLARLCAGAELPHDISEAAFLLLAQ